MQVCRCDYFIPTNQVKNNGEKLSQTDLINIGYMAGRFGISLDGDLNKNYRPKIDEKGVTLNINCCTTELFEKNLADAGIKFNVIA
jgi:hypothetical protein